MCCKQGNGGYSVTLNGATNVKGDDFASREIIYFGPNCNSARFESDSSVAVVLPNQSFPPTDPNQPSPSAGQSTPSSSTLPNQPICPIFQNNTYGLPSSSPVPNINKTQLATMIPTAPQPLKSPATEVPTTIRPTSSPTPEPLKPNIGTEGIFQSHMNGYSLNFESDDGVPRPGDNVALTPLDASDNRITQSAWKITRNGYIKLSADPYLLIEIRGGKMNAGAPAQLNVINKTTECCQ